jgi:hypothetical protein
MSDRPAMPASIVALGESNDSWERDRRREARGNGGVELCIRTLAEQGSWRLSCEVSLVSVNSLRIS